jgi:hypothetical protein
MARRLLIMAAVGISLGTAGLHVFGGGPEFHEPALASALAPEWKAGFSTIWHQITAFLLLNALFLFATGLSPQLNRGMLLLIAAQNLSFGILFLAYGWVRLGTPFVLMQWLIFFGIAALTGVAARSRQPAIEISEVEVPTNTKHVLTGADFMDAYARSLPHSGNARAVLQSLWGRTPRWVQWLLALRNLIVAPFGLVTGPRKLSQETEFIGMLPVLSETDDRVVLGLNDRHLDFRIVVDLQPQNSSGKRMVMTTLVKTHNVFGRLYLMIVKPFHRIIVPTIMKTTGP